ncbi:hypothetical protein CQR46_1575 [Bifidobacterium pseudolongum subsp. globosum]|uniref:Uncharacterized protein n=1 Tax=Bifidobacterium pseudolongum subsp. globosum TaxID=1690 RepID=A0A2N3R5T8_9BIFI|nr:hypothetical protein [Bifidobacterium pseudolongum]PKU88474.1 hypothetical protein CQR46_1575 [Bifidobacterium pseudolongum subsp. globosum]PKV04153.1 hypothetical protein CQR50_1065 [Bifidobacterium pseudolongum subsp. globosum]
MTNNYHDSTSSLAELVGEYARRIDRVNHEHAVDVLRNLGSGEPMMALGTGIFYAREDGIDVPPDMLAQTGAELDSEDGYALETYRDLMKKSRAIA